MRDANSETSRIPTYSPTTSQFGDGNIAALASTKNTFFSGLFGNDFMEDDSWPSALKLTYSLLKETIENSLIVCCAINSLYKAN